MLMEMNRNEIVTSFAFALDFLEAGQRKNIVNHNKRVGLISVRIGGAMGFKDEDLFDLYAYACMHDNGITHQTYSVTSNVSDHCLKGERNLKSFPFLRWRENVIKYHHESFDGSGFWGISGNDIPIFSQIITLADTVEIMLKNGMDKLDIIDAIMKLQGSKFSNQLTRAFCEAAASTAFWLSLEDVFIDGEIKKHVPMFVFLIELAEILPVIEIMSGIIDAKSRFTGSHSKGVTSKAKIMADYYEFNEDKKIKLMISAGLHDIGKLIIPNSIIDKPDKLTRWEYEIIKSHTFYTRKFFESINGFEDITEWASNHHEKLNGRGYPYGYNKDKLSFEAQLISCMDVYQALTEDRPYRSRLSHSESVNIMMSMVSNGEINREIAIDVLDNCKYGYFD